MAGKVGRPALPDKVHWLKGNPSKKALGQSGGVSAITELPKCPAHIKGTARKHYNELGEQLLRYGLVTSLDVGSLALAAIAYGDWVEARKEIERRDKEVKTPLAGYIARTPKGYEVMSVPLQIANAAEARYWKAVAEFGLSPSSRSRVQPTSGQIALPGMEATEQDAPALGTRLADFAS